MRATMIAIALLLASANPANSQEPQQSSPDPGTLNNGVYTNDYFTLTWEFPKGWKSSDKQAESVCPVTQSLLRLSPNDAGSEWVELGYGTWDPEDEEPVRLAVISKGWESLEGKNRYILGGGVPTLRNDFQKHAERMFLTVIRGPLRNYAVTLCFEAGSTERLDELVKAALQIKIRPDWPKNAPPSLITPAAPGSPPTRVRVSQQVSQGILQTKVQPVCPSDARKQHIEGTVLMLCHIDRDGVIKDLYVESGHPLLAQSALQAVSQWRYKPYLLNGTPVEVETQITMIFALRLR